MIAVSYILRLLLNERLRTRRLMCRIRISEMLDLIDLLSFLLFAVRQLELIGFPGIWTRRRIFVTAIVRSLVMQKLCSAEAAKITCVGINLSAICAMNHKRLDLIFQCNFYAPRFKKFRIDFIQT